MTLENYGKIWCLDHCLPISSFNLLGEKEINKSFKCINLRPMYLKEIIIESDKIDHRLHLMQEVRVYQFIKLNDQEEPN